MDCKCTTNALKRLHPVYPSTIIIALEVRNYSITKRKQNLVEIMIIQECGTTLIGDFYETRTRDPAARIASPMLYHLSYPVPPGA